MDAKAQPMTDRFAPLRHQNVTALKRQASEVVIGVVPGNFRFDDDACILTERSRQIEACKGFVQRPLRNDLALIEQHQVISQSRHFVWCVADIEQGYIQLVVQTFEVRQDFLFALHVERSQRLVHQQQARAGQQGARDADPLRSPPESRSGMRSRRCSMPSSSTA
jgi:hypothetical protein